jgi:hypothetical protein
MQREKLSQEIEQIRRSAPVAVKIEDDNDTILQEIDELEKEKASVYL